MKGLKIAIPSHNHFAPLYANIKDVCDKHGFEVIVTTEEQCGSLLLRNLVDIALLSPLGYGKAVAAVDYRIIPAHAIALEGYTKFCSVYFQAGLKSIDTIASPEANTWLMQFATLIMAEKFEATMELADDNRSIQDLLKDYEAVVDWGNNADIPGSLDLGDEWTEETQECLPVAFWVSRPDMLEEEITGIVKSFAADDLPDSEDIIEPDSDLSAEREGKIHWMWNEKIEHGLRLVLSLLYMTRSIDAVPDVKVFGREEH